jgi:hypothetical protein
MLSRKSYSALMVLIMCILTGTTHAAKSVFVISNHTDRLAQAYVINGGQVTLQETRSINFWGNKGVKYN